MSIIRFWKQGPDADSPLELVGEVPPEHCDSVVDVIRNCAPAPAGGRSEPVVVLHVDRKVLARHLKPLGPAVNVSQFQKFPSAMAASLALGFRYNEVAMSLNRAERRAELEAAEKSGPNHTLRLRPEAVVRGVVLQYERDVREDYDAYPIEDASA